jgi:hypothetical protein
MGRLLAFMIVFFGSTWALAMEDHSQAVAVQKISASIKGVLRDNGVCIEDCWEKGFFSQASGNPAYFIFYGIKDRKIIGDVMELIVRAKASEEITEVKAQFFFGKKETYRAFSKPNIQLEIMEY